ncbi:bifunctional diguanylate cyclase/phosphodiesterase [Bradyrhizobium sp.]|uniref:putative bifunctional diguanylate cyclase/phosphodiesterase n=1 Tax=Bradyrhizobium sp. TaxID=376 RepID=UPI002D44E134|nr:bifunctional diguanylate cyclase/phosphodiesterase [Bradyrhizobium sp.]HZR73054.1 bifunctional diguanylate cyclase/phosphodiesterase [Bradyrhizobium sp.]
MDFRPEIKFLEKAGYLPSPPPPSLALPAGLQIASRLIPPLALALLMALIVGAIAFFGYARLTDKRIEAEHYHAVHVGVEKLGLPKSGEDRIDAAGLRQLETFADVRKLKWETEPDPESGTRAVQAVLDSDGRILGWLSWQAEQPMTETALRFMPLWLVIAAGLLALGGLSAWYVRRFSHELETAQILAQRLSQEDAMTGLPDASAILQILEDTLASREPDEIVTCCYLDLTGFRQLSDTFGRIWSNELVRNAADRIVDPPWPGAIAGKLGRHRFVIVLRSKDSEAGVLMAEEMARRISVPFLIQGQNVQIDVIIGLAFAPRDGLTCDELFRHATLAWRAAKRAGRGKIVSFHQSMEANLHERRFIERELKRALDEDALELHYQPIVAASDSRILGLEALLRWNHPIRGNIPPMSFVPIAEECGLMTRLGEFVLYRALNDAKRWPDLFVAVNLSPIQVKDRSLFVLVSSMLAETGVDPSRVVLEITEGVLIDDPDQTRGRLEELRNLGVRIALDDFGSGYSSLRYLQNFPFDKLKIDSGFVAPLGKLANSAVIIQAIVALGRALNLSVLVEGVETEEQRVLLRLAGCDEMQGYLFAKPAPRSRIDQMLLDSKLQSARQVRAS